MFFKEYIKIEKRTIVLSDKVNRTITKNSGKIIYNPAKREYCCQGDIFIKKIYLK